MTKIVLKKRKREDNGELSNKEKSKELINNINNQEIRIQKKALLHGNGNNIVIYNNKLRIGEWKRSYGLVYTRRSDDTKKLEYAWPRNFAIQDSKNNKESNVSNGVHPMAMQSSKTPQESRNGDVEENKNKDMITLKPMQKHSKTPKLHVVFRTKIRELGGNLDNLVFLLRKKLVPRDLYLPKACFSIELSNDVAQILFTADENMRISKKLSIPVYLIEPCLKVTHMKLRKSVFKHPGRLVVYELFDHWELVSEHKENFFDYEDVVELWSFRLRDGILCIAMVKPSLLKK